MLNGLIGLQDTCQVSQKFPETGSASWSMVGKSERYLVVSW